MSVSQRTYLLSNESIGFVSSDYIFIDDLSQNLVFKIDLSQVDYSLYIFSDEYMK